MKIPVDFLDVLPIGDLHFSRNQGTILCQVSTNSKTDTVKEFIDAEHITP